MPLAVGGTALGGYQPKPPITEPKQDPYYIWGRDMPTTEPTYPSPYAPSTSPPGENYAFNKKTGQWVPSYTPRQGYGSGATSAVPQPYGAPPGGVSMWNKPPVGPENLFPIGETYVAQTTEGRAMQAYRQSQGNPITASELALYESQFTPGVQLPPNTWAYQRGFRTSTGQPFSGYGPYWGMEVPTGSVVYTDEFGNPVGRYVGQGGPTGSVGDMLEAGQYMLHRRV